MKTRNFTSLFVVVLFFTATIAFSQQTKRAITVDDFFKMKTVRGPQISPDGKWIAYTVSEMDLKKDKSERRIWMVNASGGEAMPMTSKGYSAGNPRWSPDGKYLSFLAGRGKDKDGKPNKPQVWTLNRLGGEAQQITNVKQGVSGYEWSPDGKRLALLIRDPKPEELTEDKKDDKKPKPYVIDRLQFKRDYIGYLDRFRTHLYVQSVGDLNAKPTQITSGDYDDSQPAWSPDGKSIAFVSNRSENPDGLPNTDIWIVAADNTDKGKTLLQVTKNSREDSNPSWSPDGKTIAYLTITAPLKTLWYATNRLATIPAGGGTPTILTNGLDRNIRRPKFSADGRSVVFLLEDSGEQHLASVDISSKRINRMITGETIVRDFSLNGNVIAPLISKPDQPEEIFALSNRRLRQLTFTNKKLLDTFQLSKPENIHFKSKDGTEIEGFLYKPIGYNPSLKYPTILRIHGGPVSQYTFSFSYWAQLYAANGYLVLETNPRGSSGYGQAFSYALFADWGNLDFQDVNAGVDYAIAKGYADPDRLGVGGWSYGGILTNYVITQTGRFKGAVSGASEALYRANYGHDHYQMWWEIELGLPWENAAAWERISPFNKVDKITTPTLWIGGANDWNVPILNSEQMYQAMKRLGRETQLVVYPGEHHGIRRPTFQKDRFERFLGWYDKYVKGESKLAK
ncbi:MAG: S9 family peptidase [Pyrinomonadaceae bacterium]|nr:S9 family peptidase [Pyrinomonadaceae bacterium]